MGLIMQRSILISLILFVFLAQSNLFSKNFPSNSSIISNTNMLYLYAAILESSALSSSQQDDKTIMENPEIRIINLGPVVNHKGLDYAPTVSADGRILFFVSNRKGSKLTPDGSFSHDFWAARKPERLDTVFFTPYNIDTTTNLGTQGVNTELNEGAASLAADRQSLYFTGCNRPGGYGDCDLYRTTIEGDKWGRPINLGKNVNSKFWDSQPSITPNQDRIYFASNRPGPNGDDNIDIWYCDKDPDTDEWLPAKNLTVVNTAGTDWTPFIAADGVTLFFASNGRKPNIGGFDFYVTAFDPETKQWSTPKLLPKPINTEEDDFFITLPASGDIIYFSSKRKDLPGYQGDYDIFMAFVPTFFKTIIVKVQVVDECSGVPIPAIVKMKNPITNNEIHDSLTSYKPVFETIITTQDFGNPKDSIQYIDLQVSAFNPKYGENSKTIRVRRPSTTQKQAEAGAAETEIVEVITLGQRPVLDKQIDEADYVKRMKSQKPQIANFNGLVMEEVVSWDLYPLLNYVFFDLGSSKIPDRYNLFTSKDQTKNFTDTTIARGTLIKYYHLLNIYGFRLKQFPDAKIEIVGCNDGTTPEEKRPGLSKERADNVYKYLKDIWGIEESRMKLIYKDKPDVVSNLKDSLGITENRRVEIRCSDWNIMKPVFDKDPKTLPQPEQMNFLMKNGIEDDLVVKRRIEISKGGKPWKVIQDVGTTKNSHTWDWVSQDFEYPKNNDPFIAQLVVTTTSGAECKSDPINIPVMQAKTEERIIDFTKDSTLERYSLILFPFDRFDAGPINERIMRDYVYGRCFPTSKIEVIGHTDIVGMYDHNKKLSENRANTVYNGIMKQTGGKVGEISKRGVGEDEPLYKNNLPEERFYNRTVQVIIRTPVSQFK